MSVRPVLVEVCLCFGCVSEWNLPQVPVIHIVNRGYKTVQKNNDTNIHVPNQTQFLYMYLEGKCTSLFDLYQNNNISRNDIHTILNDLSQTTAQVYTVTLHS